MVCPNCSAQLVQGDSFCDRCGGPTVKPADPLIGQVFHAEYKILRKLGEGGFGAVYEAEQLAFGRKVAIKTLHKHLSSSPNIAARFRREGIAAARLEHPSAIKILNSGQTDDNTLWLSMEFLEGKTLRDYLKERGSMSSFELVAMFSSLCEVLEEAHQKGIVHRDLKPENIMILPLTGGRSLVKVLDFGIAALMEDPSLTRTGAISGTPAYMSPEQWKGLRHTDARSDIYSLGIIAYQCLSGKLPFEADSAPEWLSKHCFETPKPLQDFIGKDPTPPALLVAVMRSIEKEPSQRQQSALALKNELEASLSIEQNQFNSESKRSTQTSAPLPAPIQLRIPTHSEREQKEGASHKELSKQSEAPKKLSLATKKLLLMVSTITSLVVLFVSLWVILSASSEDVRRSCQSGDERSCQISCEEGVATSCLKLGHLYYTGIGVLQDIRQGIQFYQKACDLNEIEACYIVSSMYSTGIGGLPVDSARGAALQRAFYAKRECEQRLPLSCLWLGQLFEEGKYVSQNPAASKKYYQQACQLGEKSACR